MTSLVILVDSDGSPALLRLSSAPADFMGDLTFQLVAVEMAYARSWFLSWLWFVGWSSSTGKRALG